MNFKYISKENLKHILILLALLPVIFLFYWMLTFKKVVPEGDGMLPLTIYSYIYSSFINFGKIFLWSPFSLGGGENLLVNYIFHGFSPSNPLLYLWLFISNLIHLKVYQSYYFYFLLNIWIGTIFVYFLGYKHLFKDKSSSTYLALVFAISGYFISNVPIMNFIQPYAWLPICLFFGLNCVYENKISDYFFLSFSIFVITLTYPPIFIGILMYVFLFLIVSLICEIDRTKNFKKYLLNFFVFICSLVLLNLGLIFTYLLYKRDVIRNEGGMLGYFFGWDGNISNIGLDLQWIFNVFVPSAFLNLWGNYANYDRYYNQFFYIGFASIALCSVGIIFFIKDKRRFSYLLSLITATLFSLLYIQGHGLFHLSAKFNPIIKYGFSKVLVIFSLLLLSGFGFNYLFINFKNRQKKLLRIFFISALVFSWVFAISLLILLKNFGKGFERYPPFLIYTFSYSFIIGCSYAISAILNKKWLFIGLMVFDLFLFLSRSYPFTGTNALQPPANFGFTSYVINNNTSFKMPLTSNYSLSKTYPGMHFSFGPLLFRETAVVNGGYMPNRRLYFSEIAMNDLFKDDNDRYHALQILGITKSRYFFADNALLVKNTKNILPALKKLYQQTSWHFTNPIVISRNENIYFQTPDIKKPRTDEITLSEDITEYLNNADSPLRWNNLNMKPEDFSVIFQDNNQKIFAYRKNLPKIDCLITENSVMESICGELIDEKGVNYYPVGSDIFNFTPGGNYIVQYGNFYATYPDSNGDLKLFVRINSNNKNMDFKYKLRYKYCDGCRFIKGGEGQSINKTIDIKIRTLKYLKGESNRLSVFNTYLPDLPSYFGQYIRRVSLINSRTGKNLPWHSSEINDEDFSIDNNVLFIYKDLFNNPFIDAEYRLNYNSYQKDLYQGTGLTVEKDTPDEIVFNTAKQKNSLLVVRNIFNRDWSAKVDGKKTDIYIINGLFMGVVVPSGNHRVMLSYNPVVIKMTTIINPLFLLITFGVFLLEKKKIIVSRITKINSNKK